MSLFLKFSSFFLVWVAILTFFSYSSWVSYVQHVETNQTLVNHPEFIPDSTLVGLTSGGFDTVVADSYWLSAVQYIGSNALGSQYKKYLYAILGLVTDLSPHFTFPYEIGELLLPSYNERYETLSEETIEKNTNEAIAIGLKGVRNSCDKEKVEHIRQEFDIQKLWTDPVYKDPCKNPMIPYYLGYIYYWNKHDGKTSSEYYRIAAANADTPTGARTMAAIMQGKSGDREKAIIMLLSLAESVEWEKQSQCRSLSKELWSILLKVFEDKKKLTSQGLRAIDAERLAIVKKLEEEWVDPSSGKDVDNFCSVYLNKSVREMNLSYLEEADRAYFQIHNAHAADPVILFDNKFIDYIPKDFQQDFQNKQEIKYFYNAENGNWDYKMYSQ